MADNRVEFELAMKDMATKELQRFRGELDKLAAQSKGAFDGVRTSSVNSTQAMINMAVAVNLLPVTGVTLPLVSMGGSSVIFTSIAFGIILSVSRNIEDEKALATE